MSKQASSPNKKRPLWESLLFFPKFPRFFSQASPSRVGTLLKRTVLWSILIALIGINIAIFRPNFFLLFIQKTGLSKNPSVKQIQYAVTQNQQSMLGQVLRVTNVLGVTSPTDNQKKLRQEYEESLRKYQKWQKIVALHEDYRDGYFKLATLAYQLNKTSESRFYLQKVRLLDPNYPGIESLEKLLPQK